jgi:hypothetical protein
MKSSTADELMRLKQLRTFLEEKREDARALVRHFDGRIADAEVKIRAAQARLFNERHGIQLSKE